jgi:hypothetical protein
MEWEGKRIKYFGHARRMDTPKTQRRALQLIFKGKRFMELIRMKRLSGAGRRKEEWKEDIRK